MDEKLEGLSKNEQLVKIEETYKRLIALDFDNREQSDINKSFKVNISGIEGNLNQYKNNNFSKENLEIIEQIEKDLEDLKVDAKINNISTDFNENFEAYIPKEGQFGFALAYEKLTPPITGFDNYIINSYIHYVSVVNGKWTDKNLVILEGEVYEVEFKNNKWEVLEEPLNNFEVKDFKIIEKREGISKEQKIKDAKHFNKEIDIIKNKEKSIKVIKKSFLELSEIKQDLKDYDSLNEPMKSGSITIIAELSPEKSRELNNERKRIFNDLISELSEDEIINNFKNIPKEYQYEFLGEFVGNKNIELTEAQLNELTKMNISDYGRVMDLRGIYDNRFKEEDDEY